MLTFLLNRVWQRLLSSKAIKDQTKTKSTSSELRWISPMFLRADEKEKHEYFQCKLTESEPDFRFAPYAWGLCALPEAAGNGRPEWIEELSWGAKLYLAKLNLLHTQKPLIAIKIATIVAASASTKYVLTQQAKKQVCNWLSNDGSPRHARIELGMHIREIWPINYQQMDGLEEVLLELLNRESVVNPEYVSSVYQLQCERRGATLNHVISIVDDPSKLLVIGRNLKPVDPEFCKSMFENYLFNGWLKFRGLDISEAELKQIADEYFQLEDEKPSPDWTKSGFRYLKLSQWGFLDAYWYPIALERLQFAACECDNPIQAADWNRAVAMNADPQSNAFFRAMEAFAKYVHGYTLQPLQDPHKLQRFACFLTSTLEIAFGERVVSGRNISLPPNPAHPIVVVTKTAYWSLVAWASESPSAEVLSVLVEAIENADDSLADEAGIRLTNIFEAKAKQDTEGAVSAVGELWRNDWYSGVTEARKSRCLSLARNLTDVLQNISPEAAKRAVNLGRSPNWYR